VALKSIQKGLNKLVVNKEKIRDDLENNRAVVAEAIQTILRREGYPNPYEALKELTRKHDKVTEEDFIAFINNLEIDDSVKEELKKISPENYTGIY
jgi:adenylosuccinate lyase